VHSNDKPLGNMHVAHRNHNVSTRDFGSSMKNRELQIKRNDMFLLSGPKHQVLNAVSIEAWYLSSYEVYVLMCRSLYMKQISDIDHTNYKPLAGLQ